MGGIALFWFTKPTLAAWWPGTEGNHSWLKRNQLTITNSNTTESLAVGTTIAITVNTKNLVRQGKLQNDCDDLRIVYQSGSSYTQLDRYISYPGGGTCADSEAAKVYFPIYSNALDADESDSNYYLYYANPQASAPADPDNAFDIGSADALLVCPFDGTTTCAAGETNQASTPGAIRYSGSRSALSFDGYNDTVTATASDSLNDLPLGDYTVEFWFFVKDNVSSYKYIHLINKDYWTGLGWGIGGDMSARALRFGQEYDTTNALAAGNGVYQYDTWNHVAVTFNSSQKLGRIFVNGHEISYSTHTPGDGTYQSDTSRPLQIGTQNGGTSAGGAFPGLLDEVRISNIIRYPSDFTPSTTPFVRDEYTRLLYHFDENGSDPRASSPVYDDSGSGNTGTINGPQYVAGLVGIDDPDYQLPTTSSQTYTGHEGMFVEEGTTNRITNPSFENSSLYYQNWTASPSATLTENTTPPYYKFGNVSAELDSANTRYPITNQSSNRHLYDTTGNKRLSQGFQVSANFSPTHASIPMHKSGTVTSRYFHLTIETDNSGHPSGTPVTNGTSICYAGSTLPGGGTKVFTFPTPPSLTTGIQYHLVLSTYSDSGCSSEQGAADASNYAYWYSDNTSATYPSGTLQTMHESTGWTSYSTEDFIFSLGSDSSLLSSIDLGETTTYTLSAYVYNPNFGNMGAPVDATFAQLMFNATPVTTTYTDTGGGWWRLAYSGTGINGATTYGITVKGGYSMYIDGLQLEEKGYPTTYADGSLGTGYAWDTASQPNNSTSTRTAADVRYATSGNMNASAGAINMWFKPNWDVNTPDDVYFFNVPRSGGTVNNNRLYIYYESGNNTLYWRVFDSNDNSSREVSAVLTSTELDKNKWTHLVATWKDGSNPAMYINGSSIGSASGTAAAPSQLYTNAFIGSYSNTGSESPDRHINAIVSEFQIFSDSLNSTEVADIYASGLVSHSDQYEVDAFSEDKGQNPVGIYHFDEGYGSVAHDSGTYGNDLMLSGTSWGTQNVGSSARLVRNLGFDGNTGLASASAAVAREMNFGTGDFSLSGWFRHSSTTPGSNQYIVSKYKEAGYGVYMDTSGHLCFGIDDDSTWGPDDAACSADGYADSSWHQFEAVRDTSTISLYVDGNRVGYKSPLTVTVTLNNTANFVIGASNTKSNYWDGSLDEIIIYPYSRTPDQVKADFTGGQTSSTYGKLAADPLSEGLVGYWKMDSSLSDFSGNEISVASNGSPSFTSGKFGNAIDLESGSSQFLYGSSGALAQRTGSVTIIQSTNNSDSQSIDAPSDATGIVVATGGWDNTHTNMFADGSVSWDGNSMGTARHRNDKVSNSNVSAIWAAEISTTGSRTFAWDWEGTDAVDEGGVIFVMFVKDVDWTNPIRDTGGQATSSGGIMSTGLMSEELGDLTLAFYSEYNTSAVSWTGATQIGSSIDYNSDRFEIAETSPTGSHTITASGAAYMSLSAIVLVSSPIADTTVLPLTSDVSISSWIKPETNTASTQYNIAGKWDDGEEGYLLAQYGDEIRFYINSGSVYAETTSVDLATSGWYFVVGVYDTTTQTIKIYVNGQESVSTTTGTIPATITNTGGIFHIGAANSAVTAENFYDGVVDEVRVYNRGLSPAEVKQLYQWTPGPVGYWKLDEGSGTTAYDSSGNGYNANISNSGWAQGKYGNAMVTRNDSIQDKATITDPTSGSLDFSNSDSFTLEAWVKSTGNNEGMSIISKGGSSVVDVGYRLYVDSGDNKYQCRYSDGDGSGLDYVEIGQLDIGHDGEWHYLVCVMDRDGSVTGTPGLYGYLDGILKSTEINLTESSAKDNSSNLLIGETATYAEDDAFIDEVKIYNYSRNQAQIVQDMNAGHPAPGSPVGSPIAWYKFDEGYGDTVHNSGNGGSSLNGDLGGTSDNCPTYTGDDNCPTWTNEGKYGKGISLDGTYDYVYVPDSDYLGTNGQTALTISYWTYPLSQDNGDVHISKFDGSDTWNLSFSVNTLHSYPNNYPRFFVAQDGNTDDTLTSSTVLTNNTWHHIVDVFDGSKMYIYLDGKLDTSKTTTITSIQNSDAPLIIGGDYDNGTVYPSYNGQIDEVKIYNLPLTSDQVKTEYNAGKAAVFGSLGTDSSGNASFASSESYCPPASPAEASQCVGPVAEWNFNEGTGQYANDTSGNSNTGTLGSGSTPDSADPLWANAEQVPPNTTGLGGKVLSFDGTDDYVIRNPKITSLDGKSAITASAWIRPAFAPDAATRPTRHALNISDGGQSGPEIYFSDNGSRYVANCQINTSVTGQFSVDTQDTANWNTNTWHYITCRYTGSKLEVYWDGQYINSANGSGNINNNTSNWSLIGSASPVGGFWWGSIDNASLYDYARTPAQIAWDYNRGGPTAWWKLDDNVTGNGQTIRDSSGNGHDGTTVDGGGTALDCTVSGKISTACSFDGSNDYINSNSVLSELFANNNVSISVWAKPEGTAPSSNKPWFLDKIAVDYDVTDENYIMISRGISTDYGSLDRIWLELWDGNSDVIGIPYTVNTWNHIVLVHTGGMLYGYGNGELAGSTPSGNIQQMTRPLYIGGRPGHWWFHGQIDDVRIYNYGLTAEQVKLLYNNGAVNFAP